MSNKINQSKFFNSVSAEIIRKKGIVKFANKKFFKFYGREIPLEHINPDVVIGSKINSSSLLASLILIAFGLAWIFNSIIHWKPTNISNIVNAFSVNLDALVVGGLGVLFMAGGIMVFLSAISESSKFACFKSYVDNQPLLFFYCSRKYENDFIQFKNELINAISRLRKTNAITDYFANLDGEFLLDVLPAIIIPEMKKRNYDVDKYLKSLIKSSDLTKKDNVVSLT